MADLAANGAHRHRGARVRARLAEETRNAAEVRVGVSVRGALALVRCAKVWAAAHGRNYVLPDDIKELAQPVWGHRFVLDPEAEFAGSRPDAVPPGSWRTSRRRRSGPRHDSDGPLVLRYSGSAYGKRQEKQRGLAGAVSAGRAQVQRGRRGWVTFAAAARSRVAAVGRVLAPVRRTFSTFGIAVTFMAVAAWVAGLALGWLEVWSRRCCSA